MSEASKGLAGKNEMDITACFDLIKIKRICFCYIIEQSKGLTKARMKWI